MLLLFNVWFPFTKPVDVWVVHRVAIAGGGGDFKIFIFFLNVFIYLFFIIFILFIYFVFSKLCLCIAQYNIA